MHQAVTGHIATVRKQGGEEGGKVILLKNKFKGKSAEDIWSSLILSLPAEDIRKMAPGEKREVLFAEPDVVDAKETIETMEMEDEKHGTQVEEDVVEVVTLRLEDAATKKERMDKSKSVKDLKKEYDKFAR